MTFTLSAPPPAANVPRHSVAVVQTSPQQIAVATAIDAIRKREPALYQVLHTALHGLLDPESTHIVRVPKEFLEISQGRVQVAHDILSLLDHCSEIVQRQQRGASPNGRATV